MSKQPLNSDSRPPLSFSPALQQEISPLNQNLAFDGIPKQCSSSPEHKKSPVKYSYLRSEGEEEYIRGNRIFWLECFSMFVFIYTSTCSKEAMGIDLYYFLGVLIAIPICAKQTGANLNPAVSYSMTYKAMDKPLSYKYLLWIYIKAQITGSILAMTCAVILNNVHRSPVYPASLPTTPSINTSFSTLLGIILSQAIGTFMLIFIILYGTGPYSFISSNQAKYLYIAIFVYIGRKFAVSSNNQINIALTISQAFVGMIDCDFGGFKFMVVWAIGGVIGVAAAGYLYSGVVEPTLEYLQTHETQKAMARLRYWHEKQLKQMHNLAENKKSFKQQSEQAGKEETHHKFKDYYKRLSYF